MSARSVKLGLEMTQNLDKEKKQILDDCYNETKNMLEDNRAIFDKVIKELMEKGTLSGDEFLQLVKKKK